METRKRVWFLRRIKELDRGQHSLEDVVGHLTSRWPTTPDIPGDLPPAVRDFDGEPNLDIPPPGVREVITEPLYGTEVTRVGDGVHRYPSKAAWNADDSLLILDGRSPRGIYDGDTFEHITDVNTGTYWAWSRTDPAIAYNVQGTRIQRREVRGDVVVAAEFDPGWRKVMFGGGHGEMSDDDSSMCVGYWEDEGDWGVAVLDLNDLSIKHTRRLGSSSSDPFENRILDHTMTSHDGRYHLAQFTTRSGAGQGRSDDITEHKGAWILSHDLTDAWQFAYQQEHSDWAQKRDGSQVICRRSGTNDEPSEGFWMYDIDAGDTTTGAGGSGGVRLASTSSLHCSGRTKRKGIVVAGSSRPGGSGSGFSTTIVAYDLDDIGLAYPFAQDHHESSTDRGPVPVISTDGDRVIWRAEWGGSEQSYVAGVDVIR